MVKRKELIEKAQIKISTSKLQVCDDFDQMVQLAS